MDWNVATHNGSITMVNTATGQHRTVRVKTQPDDSKFAAGKRVLSLRTGSSDSWHDWTQFGFVIGGLARVWKRFEGTKFETFCKMVNNPQSFEARGVVYKMEGACRKCNRTLTNPISIDLGIGPVCGGRE